MTSKRLYGPAVLGSLMLLCTAQPAVSAPEPLVVTPMADPDPNFVPPPPEKHEARAWQSSDEHTTLDQAMESLGRVAGQVAQIAEQRAGADGDRLSETACKSVESARSSGVDVSAWDKACRH